MAATATNLSFLASPRHSVECPQLSSASRAAFRPAAGRTTAIKASMSTSTTPERRSANYKPTVWDNSFLQSLRSDCMDEAQKRRHEMLDAEVRRMFVDMVASNSKVESLVELVDAIQQLGLDYRFEKEIKDSLDSISIYRDEVLLQGSLCSSATLFRLLRGNGYDIQQDVFNGFVDANGGFDQCCGRDIEGVLSLYEASFYGMEGERLLDEAMDFTTKRLEELRGEISIGGPQFGHVEKIKHALEFPLNWWVPRFHARWFIDMYAKAENMNPTVLELAKLDFNVVQNVHKEDLRETSRWWADLNLAKKLPFARDRVVEIFLGGVGIVPQPQHGYFRLFTTQALSLLTLLDDTYDVYGFMNELELLTDVIERWDVKAMEQLPDYIKTHLLPVFNTVDETAQHIQKEKGVDTTLFLRRSWIKICKAYLLEAKWYHRQYIPTLEQYINNAFVTSSLPLIALYTYILTCQDIRIETLEYLENNQDLITSASTIARLADDLSTSTDELNRGDVHKATQCYMHHENVSEEVAREEIRRMILETWKKANKERFAVALPKSTVDGALNAARVSQFLYRHGDGYGVAPDKETKDQIMSLLVKNMPLLD